MTHIIKKGFNQRSQSLHFRKRQYDPNSQSVRDESFNNGDARAVQDGRYYFFDGLDSVVSTDYDWATNGGNPTKATLFAIFKTNTESPNSYGALNSSRNYPAIWLSDRDGDGINNNPFLIFADINNNLKRYYIDEKVLDGNWHVVVATWDNQTIRGWLDGVEKTLVLDLDQGLTSNQIGVNNNNNVAIGARTSTTTDFSEYEGDIYMVGGIAGEAIGQGDVEAIVDMTFNWSRCSYCFVNETNDSKVFDISGNGFTGDLLNANLGTALVEKDDAYYSFQNNVGYTLSDGSTYYEDQAATTLIPQGVLIPRDENNTTKCTAFLSNGDQADLQYSGKVPYTVYAKDSNCGKFDGVSGNRINTKKNFDFVHQTGVFRVRWVGRIDNINDDVFLISNRLGRSRPSFGLQYNNNQYTFKIGSVDNNGFIVKAFFGNGIANDGSIHDVEVIGDGNEVDCYIDGQLYVTETITQNFDQSSAINPVGIGSYSGTEKSLFLLEGITTYAEIVNTNDSRESGKYPVSEGSNNIIYDVSGNGFDGEIEDASLANFWSERQDVFHYNIEHGFDLWVDGSGNKLYVPFDEKGNSIKTHGDTISGFSFDSKHEPSTNFHNGAETRFDTNAEDPHFGDFKRAVSDTGIHPSNSVSGDDQYYIRKLPDDEADRFTLYLNDQVNPQKLKTELFTQ